MAKRLICSNATPNDQGGIIPTSVIDLSRYIKNPILCREHRWTDDPLGRSTDIQIEKGVLSVVPYFHLETKESREAAGMYEKDCLNAASIGGFALWKKNKLTNEYERDAQGFRICEKYYLYEISLVGLPSNEDAVGTRDTNAASQDLIDRMVAKFYEEADLEQMEAQFTTFSTKFNYSSMKKKPGEPGYDPKVDGPEVAEPVALTAVPGAAATKGAEPTILATTVLPGVIQQAIDKGYSVTLSAPPAPKNEPTSTQGQKETGDPQPEPIGLKAAKEALAASEKKLNRARKAADNASKVLNAAKAKDDKECSDMSAAELATALKTAQDARTALAAAESDVNAAKEEVDEEEQSAKDKTPLAAGQRSALSAAHRPEPAQAGGGTPQFLTAAEMEATLRRAAVPSLRSTLVKRENQGVTYTQLNSPLAKDNEKNLMRRVCGPERRTTDQVHLADHALVLNSILNDPRLSGLAEVFRMNLCAAGAIDGLRKVYHQDQKGGMSLQNLSAEMQAGRTKYWNRANNQMEDLSLLTSTDNALAAPALNTIEWLTLAIFELFPTTTWKSSIPMFAAQMMSANTGTIWANITANPAIYKGTQPVNPADYSYDDDAVSLALTPYYLQPMTWNPLKMHQLRYDQQATGWAQAFAAWNAVMDDNLIYTFMSTVPAAARIPTSGLSGYQAGAQAFNIPASGPQNSFYWSPNFAGNLLAPTLNDIIAIEQVYRNQNFVLEREKGMLVIDSIMERYLAQDPETKSLLTAHVDRNGETFLGYKHTSFDVRSRVGVYDPTTGQVKDINAAIPATAMSAAFGFLPSQLGIGIGMLDVFMVQDPSVYGYRMSADIRIGGAPLRKNFAGTSLYYYGNSNV